MNLNDHPSEHGVLPFIFYPTKDDDETNTSLCTIVKIAAFDCKYYDAEWMNDKDVGNNPLVPDVDLCLEKKIFDSELEAIQFIRNWWTTAKLSDYEYFTKKLV